MLPRESGTAPQHTVTLAITGASGSLYAVEMLRALDGDARVRKVNLKEQRPLILCVRETPFNRIHLRNMLTAAEAGATIFPAIPTLYNHPESTAEMARNFVHRVLAHLGLPQPGAYVWQAD